MRETANVDGLKIGQLAGRTGRTVRTLHHYDRIGLLTPSRRTASGHRRYSEPDVRRLYAIVALRQLGLPLAEIAGALDRGRFSLREAVIRQLEALERHLEESRRLRTRLEHPRDEFDRRGEPSRDELIDAMEAITMHERYYTKEQLEQLERRREELGAEAIERSQREWAELIEQVRAEHDAGTDPGAPRMQELARRWFALVEQFTGGDPGIRDSLARMYANEDPAVVSRGMLDRDLMVYAQRAREAGGW